MSTEELLVQLNIDFQNRKIRDYYEADNLWFTLRIGVLIISTRKMPRIRKRVGETF